MGGGIGKAASDMQLWREIRKVLGLLWVAESARSRRNRLSWSSLICAWSGSNDMVERLAELGFVDDCTVLSVMIISRSMGRRGMP